MTTGLIPLALLRLCKKVVSKGSAGQIYTSVWETAEITRQKGLDQPLSMFVFRTPHTAQGRKVGLQVYT